MNICRIAACAWSMGIQGPDALDAARRIGLQGLEINGDGLAGDQLKIADPAHRAAYRRRIKETGIPVISVCLDLLCDNPLATDPRAPGWVQTAIDAAAELGAGIVLLPFFGPGDLKENGALKADAVDATVRELTKAAAIAEKKGIVLGIENTLSYAESTEILARIGSPAVKVYYDVGNAGCFGLDPAAELRQYRDAVCQVHFKDGGFLGHSLKMPEIMGALHDTKYSGWVVLETNIPTGDMEADFRRNAAILRYAMEDAR